jgi:hypothetical protein
MKEIIMKEIKIVNKKRVITLRITLYSFENGGGDDNG